MPILALQILPPFSIARFGSSHIPLEAFDLDVDDENRLGYRRIIPAETLKIDRETGSVASSYIPKHIKFKDGDRIRPVAPFLEVYAQTSETTLEPLTTHLLAAEGLTPADILWRVEVGNLKIFRQTFDPNDKILAIQEKFNDHDVHELHGECINFLESKYIPFGSVRYIRPTESFPEIRLRFTPAKGKVYGASLSRFDLEHNKSVKDPVFQGHDDRIVYDSNRGKWLRFQSNPENKFLTNPSDIYQGFWPETESLPISWGYIDDVCDGPVAVELTLKSGTTLKSRSWISTCMPAFAPDSLPIRTVADELEQLILGHEVADEEVSIEAASEIVRRALETVRLMNTAAMNGNVINGRTNIAHTLITQDTNDLGRLYAPIFASTLVDNFAVRILHERIFAALTSGTATWFASVLRRPEEVGDLSDKARRKMPPMLRGADGRALCLTRRQISKIVKAAALNIFNN